MRDMINQKLDEIESDQDHLETRLKSSTMVKDKDKLERYDINGYALLF